MVAKKPGRYLAPVALIAVAVAVLMIVLGRGTSHHAAAASPPPAHHTSTVASHVAPKKRFYVIKAGDSLSGISVKTGVSIATLEALNPSINPNALQTGSRIRLTH